MRIDKFLKVSRLIKRRSVAKDACGDERIFINGKPVQPSKEVKVSNYVSGESQDRIQRTVNQFNSLFNKTLNIIRNEFGDILSDDAMNTLTLQLLT